MRRSDHAFNSPVSKAAGNENPVTPGENAFGIVRRDFFRVDPSNGHDGIVGGAGMEQRFHNGEIGVVELRIFPHQGDLNLAVCAFDSFYQGGPGRQIRLWGIQLKLFTDDLIQPLFCQHERNLV